MVTSKVVTDYIFEVLYRVHGQDLLVACDKEL